MVQHEALIGNLVLEMENLLECGDRRFCVFAEDFRNLGGGWWKSQTCACIFKQETLSCLNT